MTYSLKGTSSRRLRPRARLALWMTTVSFCLFGGGLRLWQNHQRRVARQTWEQQKLQREQKESAKTLHIRRMWRRYRGSWTADELAEALNGGESFELSERGRKLHAFWTDPATGARYEFSFAREGTWTGYGIVTSLWIPVPVPPAFDKRTDRIRRWVAGWNGGMAPFIWIVLLILLLAWRRYRCVLSEFLLAVALIAATAWFVNPGYSLTLKGIFSNDMLFWAVIMIIVSIVTVVLVHRVRVTPTEPLCPTCGYNLTGNTSGRCPECGRLIPLETQKRIESRAV